MKLAKCRIYEHEVAKDAIICFNCGTARPTFDLKELKWPLITGLIVGLVLGLYKLMFGN